MPDDNEAGWQGVDGGEIPRINITKPLVKFYVSFRRIKDARSAVESTATTPDSNDLESEELHSERQHIAVQPNSRLLTLPAEIRLTIYEMVFQYPHTITVGLRRLYLPPIHSQISLDILLACRQIHFEAEKLFYQLNKLCIPDLPRALTILRPIRREAITNISIPEVDAVSTRDGLSQLHLLPNLRFLWVNWSPSSPSHEPASWMDFAREVLAEAGRHERLEELKFFVTERTRPDEREAKREQRLREIRDLMESVVTKEHPLG